MAPEISIKNSNTKSSGTMGRHMRISLLTSGCPESEVPFDCTTMTDCRVPSDLGIYFTGGAALRTYRIRSCQFLQFPTPLKSVWWVLSPRSDYLSDSKG